MLLSYYPYWPLGETACNIWSSVFVALGSASVCNLCAIRIDRFLGISRPLRYFSDISSFFVVSLVFIWSFAVFSGIASSFIWKQPDPLVCSMLASPLESSVLFLVFDLLEGLLVPFVICLLTYAKVFQISRQQARRIIVAQGWIDRKNNPLSMVRKSAKTLSLLVGAFAASFLPFLVFHAIDGALEEKTPHRFYYGSVVKWLTCQLCNKLGTVFLYVVIPQKIFKKILYFLTYVSNKFDIIVISLQHCQWGPPRSGRGGGGPTFSLQPFQTQP